MDLSFPNGQCIGTDESVPYNLTRAVEDAGPYKFVLKEG